MSRKKCLPQNTAAPVVVRSLTGRTITLKPGGVRSIVKQENSILTGAKKRLDKRYFATEEEREAFARLVIAQPGRSKVNAKGWHLDGQYFASTAEAVRYLQLKDLAEAGLIDNLVCHPVYPLNVNGRLVCKYIADFRYDVVDDRGSVLRTVVEDVKGMIMPVYKLKRKLLEAVHQVDVLEIKGGEIRKWAGRTG